jgi:hypothetical protein
MAISSLKSPGGSYGLSAHYRSTSGDQGSTAGLKLYEPGQQEPAWVNETYSGTGEVFAVYELTRTRALWHKAIGLRRSEQRRYHRHREPPSAPG